MNKVILKGRLTDDPKTRNVGDTTVCNFTVAVDRRFGKDKTDFINCEAWKNTADLIKHYFKKGKEILVCGELHIDKTVKDGVANYYTKVAVDEVNFCGSKNDIAEVKTDDGNGNSVSQFVDEDLPF